MKRTISQQYLYLISALFGAVIGGILVMIATKAIPTVMTQIMSGMMSQMEACGCDCNAM